MTGRGAIVLLSATGLAACTPQSTPLTRAPIAADVGVLMVQACAPDRSPEQVEADVTKPVERAFRPLAGLTGLSSTTRDHGATIYAEFADPAAARAAMPEAQRALAEAQRNISGAPAQLRLTSAMRRVAGDPASPPPFSDPRCN